MDIYCLKKQPLALDVWQTCSSKQHSVSIPDCDILEKNHVNGNGGRDASIMVFIHTHAATCLPTHPHSSYCATEHLQ